MLALTDLDVDGGVARQPRDVVDLMRPVGIRVLGPPTLQLDDDTLPLRPGRQRLPVTILAAAASRSRSLTADELIEAVYGPYRSTASRGSVKTEIWRLRQMLGAAAVIGDTSGYRLDPAICEIDLVTFERQVVEGRGHLHSGRLARAEAVLAAALGQWRGDLSSDWESYPLARAIAARLVELRLGAAEDHAQALAADGRCPEAIGELEALTAAHP